MKRALRCDKMTLAALETLLKLYANPDQLAQQIPSLRLLSRQPQDIQKTADALHQPLQAFFGDSVSIETASCQSQVGSGAMPVESLPSYSLVLSPRQSEKNPTKDAENIASVSHMAARLRKLPVPVIGRINKNTLILDLRCLESKDSDAFVANLESGRG